MSEMVTALMVTRSSRVAMAKRAVGDFVRQTYPHKRLAIVFEVDLESEPLREELIAYPGHNYRHPQLQPLAEFAKFLNGFGGITFPTHVSSPGKPLGELRNASLTLVGDDSSLITQWDDDDRHHPDRIIAQANALTRERQACCLTSQLYLHRGQKMMHWVDWNLSPTQGSGNLIPGTILFRKDLALAYDATKRRGEDTLFLQQVLAHVGPIAPVDAKPWLYVRQFHGQNTSPESLYRANIRDRARKYSFEFADVAGQLAPFIDLHEPVEPGEPQLNKIQFCGSDRVCTTVELPVRA